MSTQPRVARVIDQARIGGRVAVAGAGNVIFHFHFINVALRSMGD